MVPKNKIMKSFLILLALCGSVSVYCQSSDEIAIRDVITTSYIEGIQNRGNAEDIRKGFASSFTMLRLTNNEIKPLPIGEWITNIEKAKAANEPQPPKAEGKFISVDVTGTAAVVKLDLYRGGKRTFTDYLVLYKFTEGWKIVSKTFYRHPDQGSN
jgi:hypothetical protein